MSAFLVYFEKRDDGWRVPRDVFMERLAEDWPEAELVPDEAMGRSEMRDVGWNVTQSDEELEGWLSKSGEGISIDGDEELAVRVASWFRGLIPDDVDVTFCDDMYSFNLLIPAGASADELMELYSAA